MRGKSKRQASRANRPTRIFRVEHEGAFTESVFDPHAFAECAGWPWMTDIKAPGAGSLSCPPARLAARRSSVPADLTILLARLLCCPPREPVCSAGLPSLDGGRPALAVWAPRPATRSRCQAQLRDPARFDRSKLFRLHAEAAYLPQDLPAREGERPVTHDQCPHGMLTQQTPTALFARFSQEASARRRDPTPCPRLPLSRVGAMIANRASCLYCFARHVVSDDCQEVHVSPLLS